jgi:UDP-N-acetylmuramoylalanine--D-glutamate ligase
VILGGRGKAEPYGRLAEALDAGDHVYLIGEAGDAIADALSSAGVRFERSGDLPTAVAAAARAARVGDVVLLSPACASFDQFRSFEHRGEEFRALVSKLPG